jgi:hypothetical protein
MRFTVESWSTDYGAPTEGLAADEEPDAGVDPGIEVPPEKWAPIAAPGGAAACVVFVDGAQQMDARVWVDDPAEGMSKMGICVTLAAGAVRCSSEARVESVIVQRAAFGPAALGTIDCGNGIAYAATAVTDTSPAHLDIQLRRRREDLEVEVAHATPAADLIIVDGHVRQRETIAGAVGFIKTHQRQYLEPALAAVVGRLRAGERTPVFLLETPWGRYSWYLKLPGGEGHAWAGVVRCEASPSLRPAEVAQFAGFVAASLPRFASGAHKDPRAPQNLYPIAGLERELRRRMGDTGLLLRSLQRAAHAS